MNQIILLTFWQYFYLLKIIICLMEIIHLILWQSLIQPRMNGVNKVVYQLCYAPGVTMEDPFKFGNHRYT